MRDVAVIGGGVVGVACALELARRGASVTILERDRIGSGCSGGNAGWLTPSLAFPLPAPGLIRQASRWLLDPDSPFYIHPRPDPGLAVWLVRFAWATRRNRFERGAGALIALARWSVDAWEELSRIAPKPFGYARAGLLAIYESEETLAAGLAKAELAGRFGVRSEEWSVDDVREREPAVRGPHAGAVFYPDDAHCRPAAAVAALAREAIRAGVRIVDDCEVYAFESEGPGVNAVLTTRGRVPAGQIVLAVGAWSRALGGLLGLHLPVLGGKGYSLVLPRHDPHPVRSVFLADRKIAVNPHDDALRISGTLELVADDLGINRRRVNAIARGAQALLAVPDPLPDFSLWRGLRPCTPDGMPLIGRARGRRNVWLATGHQMTGLKTAPATGRLLAELMSGEPPTFDPLPFRADRY